MGNLYSIPMKRYIFFILLVCQLSLEAQWVLRPLNSDFGQMTLWFSDSMNGYLTGQDGTPGDTNDGGIILGTHDGGITWDTLLDPSGSYNYPAVIQFQGNFGITANRKSDIYISADSGESWTTADFDGTDFLYGSLDFANPQVALIAGWSGEVFRIQDAGTSIENVFYLGTPYNSIYNLQCGSNDTCYFNNYDGLYRSTDAGETWAPIYTPTSESVIDFFVYPNNTIICLETYEEYTPIVLKSVDAGVSWDTISVLGQMNHYYDMSFYDSVGYIIGDNYKVLNTTDSGKTWSLIFLDSIPESYGYLVDIQLLDAETGFITGQDGLFYTMGVESNPEPPEQSALFIYPNPAEDIVELISTSDETTYVYAATGALLAQFPAHTTQLNISTLAAGVYFVHQGNAVVQLIKQ